MSLEVSPLSRDISEVRRVASIQQYLSYIIEVILDG